MLRAQQQLLVQSSNKILLSIREMEVNYFQNYFSQYNTLAGLLAGFQLVSITQVVVQDYGTARYIKTLYWISTVVVFFNAATFAPSLHCLFITSFLIVYGPNLALRGPLGSMKRAIDGMVKEQREVFYSYLLTLFIFSVSVTCTFWLEAYDFEANICTVIMCLGALVQYHFCLRIYNRFKFDDDFLDDWDKTENERKVDIDDEVPDGTINDMHLRKSSISNRSESVASITSQGTVRVLDSGRHNRSHGVIRTLINKSKNDIHNPINEIVDHSHDMSTEGVSSKGEYFNTSDKLYKEGYFAFKSGKNSNFSSWDRYYFVLSGVSLWMYKDRQKFTMEPDRPVKLRPISLENYEPLVLESSKSYKLLLSPCCGDTTLSPWTLKFDTESEQEMWLEAFQMSRENAIQIQMKL